MKNGTTQGLRAGVLGALVGGAALGAAMTASADVRNWDGWGNNPKHPSWGATNQQLRRNTPIAYADGVSQPAGPDRPNPRVISGIAGAQDRNLLSARLLSDFHTVFGQFLDHDIDHTPDSLPTMVPIPVPAGDPWFDPFAEGDRFIPLRRSMFDWATGDGPDNPRRQVNAITAWLDGSVVYGNGAFRGFTLQTLDGTGKLVEREGGGLPYNTFFLPNGEPSTFDIPDEELFVAGDARANENCQLLAFHELFVLEHNRLCDVIAERHPDWDGEQIYQYVRKLVGGMLQVITYEEFLPSLLGEDAIPPYQGYDPSVDPTIANVFQTVAFRYGHSQVNETMLRLDEQGLPHPMGHLNSRDALFAPDVYVEVPMASWLMGAAKQVSQEIDLRMVSSLRNFMFGPAGTPGLDLYSMNIQRGREHGLPDYNTVRVSYGLPAVTDWSEISADPQVQADLAAAYGDVDLIDPWVGGLAEDHVPGASVGPLFHAIMVDQFVRIRDGDRFWYSIDPDIAPEDVAMIESTTMHDIVVRNTGWTNFPENPWFCQPGDYEPLLADLTLDGIVDGADLMEMIQSWGPIGMPGADNRADFNGDASIDFGDLLHLLSTWTG